jgi:hypothetical protein
MIGLVAAAALAVAACGSNSAGTPTAAATAAATTPSAAATSSAAMTSEATSSAETSMATSSESAESADTTAESADTGSETAGGDTDTSEAPTTTLHGTIDDATVNWFTIFCTNFGPAAQKMEGMGSAMTNPDPTQGQAAIADMFDQIGAAFTKTAGELATAPPPSIEHGAEIAAKYIAGMTKAGTAYTAAGAEVRAADVKTAEDLQKAVTDASSKAEQAMGDFDMGNYDLDPALQKQLKEIPACKSFMGDN